MIKVFGHKSPDTDCTGSAIIAAWFYSEILGKHAAPYVLGALNPETKFVLERWGIPEIPVLEDVEENDEVVIVDTNNAEELPASLDKAQILQIIDHHRFMGNITTSYVVDTTIKTLASTASVLLSLMSDDDRAQMPDAIKGIMLSCILSDTLEFRSPTTTDYDQAIAEELALELDLNISEYAAQMFEAKSDVSDYSAEELVKMDSKVAEFEGRMYRVGVLETASPKVILDRKLELVEAQTKVCADENLAEAFLFIIDILNEEATLLVPNEATKIMAEQSFNVQIEGDTVVLPGVVSRKKQIIPQLKVA
jgi:manganese-dependent inorganic pyrophosphatase